LGEYPEAAVVIVLYVLGERLEDIGLENSKSALDQLVNRAPKTAFVKLENKNIPVNKVTVGTIIQVKPGEMIPLDGKIISGETTVDEAAITGEPIQKTSVLVLFYLQEHSTKMVLLKWKLLPSLQILC
jgi:Cd2+/Zn2+-exporting ATPase